MIRWNGAVGADPTTFAIDPLITSLSTALGVGAVRRTRPSGVGS